MTTNDDQIEEISICDGKYTLKYNPMNGDFSAFRYGEKFRDLCGDKFVYALFCELLEHKNNAEPTKALFKGAIHVDTVILAEGSVFEMNIHRYHNNKHDVTSQILNALVEEIISINKELKRLKNE